MNIEERKKSIKANVQFGTKKPERTGGQTCGVPVRPVILKSEELDLEITIGYHRSQFLNRELAYTIFELVLDDLIK